MHLFDEINEELRSWIQSQKVFFVATAPLSEDGHINLSPKGHDCLRILDERTVCYMDMSGSGNETSAHVAENGRITFMWCAFEGAPRILRLYGSGEVVLRDSPKWKEMSRMFEVLPGARQIIINHVERVQTSCGYAVPFFDYQEDRETLKKYYHVKERQGQMEEYWKNNNMKSIDGLETPLSSKMMESGQKPE